MTAKRLYRYALRFKKTIMIALVLLTVAVSAELTGPFIAKTIIDDHITGIEQAWVMVEDTHDPYAVSYQGALYKRGDRLTETEAQSLDEAATLYILQVGTRYYVTEDTVPSQGEAREEAGEVYVQNGEERIALDTTRLSAEDVFGFYQPEVTPIIKWLGLYVGLLIFASFFQYGKSYLLQMSANRIIQNMRHDVFTHIQTLPVSFFDQRPVGKIVSRITNDTEAIRELYMKVLATFFTSIIYMTGIYIALFLLDVTLASITLLVVPLIVLWTILYRRYASRFNHAIRARLSDINGMINESIQGMPIIQVFGRQKRTEEEFEQLNEDHFHYQNKLLHLNAMTSHNLVFTIQNICFVVLIWYFGGAAIGVGSVISIGLLYAFVDYLNRLFQPVSDIVNQLAQLDQAMVAGERVFHLLDQDGEGVEEGKIPKYQGDVAFEQVSFAYEKDQYVLKDISFEANQGETVALVGHTGSGKSSIMNLLFRFYDPQHGRIKIDGQDITTIPKQHIRQHMGIVLQDPFLFTGTIASNVSLNDPSISKEKVINSLKMVGADRFIEPLPHQYDEPVVEKGSTLSSGQRQLISFARALAFDPAILILDEATANIDTETEAMIQRALEVLKRGRTTFIIAHRLSTIREADHILVLDHGHIVEQGKHDALIQQRGKYQQMYQMQMNSQPTLTR
ncbi:ABC transporter ATP-binding protein [Caldalkalibacillus salinus]|uniref:ABC transporter ATP-binding protein n=1 Tax=Caldalkalibacillus salinus TaxID=2803787 RepID=UPI001921EA9B|nr:ABC transporter ATP-binding protein [Caldalkalibacillus salinus]